MAEQKLTYEEWREKEVVECEERCKNYSEPARWERLQNYVCYLEMWGEELYSQYLEEEKEGVCSLKLDLMDDKFLINNKAVNEPNNR